MNKTLECFLMGLEAAKNLPKDLKTSDASSWVAVIDEIYQKLNDEQTSKLLQLSDDPTEADRLVEKLNKHKVLSEYYRRIFIRHDFHRI